MSQPKLPPDLAGDLNAAGLTAHCYQPVSQFKRTPPRTLPNVPRDDDPWEVFLRRTAVAPIGLVAVGYGSTLREAIEDAIRQLPGVGASLRRAGDAIDDLVEAIRCL